MGKQEDLNLAKKAARAAIKTINEYKKKGINIRQKGYHDLVTDADVAAENSILEVIKNVHPDDLILAEESASYSTLSSARTWIIDPIDGTTNFAHDFPIYCVSIALWVDRQPSIGVVIEVNRDEEFSAISGEGAWLNGEPISVSEEIDPGKGFVATGFPYNDLSMIDPFMKLLKVFMEKLQGIRRPGSAAYDMCCVACGRFDGFYEYSLHIWDVAAASLIIREAGGIVTDWNGEEGWPFGQRVVVGNTAIHKYLLENIIDYIPDSIRNNVE